MKLTVKKILLQIGGYIVSVTPIVVYAGLNWKRYTATTASCVSLGIGGAIAFVLILLKALNHIPKNVKPIIKYCVVFALVLALEPLIIDLKYLLAMAIIGEILDIALFQWAISRTDKQINAQFNVDAQKSQHQELIEAIKSINTSNDDVEGRT